MLKRHYLSCLPFIMFKCIAPIFKHYTKIRERFGVLLFILFNPHYMYGIDFFSLCHNLNVG